MKRYIVVRLNEYEADKLDSVRGDFYARSRRDIIMNLILEHEKIVEIREMEKVSSVILKPITEAGYEKMKKKTKREEQEYECVNFFNGEVVGNCCVYDSYSFTGTKSCDKYPAITIPLDLCLNEDTRKAAFYPDKETCLNAPEYLTH